MRPTATRPFGSPSRTSSTKLMKSFPSLELNSYKIDTSSLSQKAKEIEQLKFDLETQISQYKASEQLFHDEIEKLSQENKELRAKVKKLQTQLKELNMRSKSPVYQKEAKSPKTPLTNTKEPSNLSARIFSLQQQLSTLKTQLTQKNLYITQLEQYKKMYDIQVQNKNNIMNFYENKLTLFQKDKHALINKYEEKISQLGSGLEMNATIIQQQARNSVVKGNGKQLGQVIDGKGGNQYRSEREITVKQQNLERKTSSSKNIKFIKTSRQSQGLNDSRDQGIMDSRNSLKETPYKLLKQSSNQNYQENMERTPSSRQNIKGELNEISISSSGTKKESLYGQSQRKGQAQNSNRLGSSSRNNPTTSAKTIRNDDLFLKMIRQLFTNLRRQSIKSESIKNFSSVRQFISNCQQNPSNLTSANMIKLLEGFPFGPLELSRQELQSCVEKSKQHLMRKYNGWSGMMFVELLIDKIEDFQIAYEVNSEDQAQIVAGLSSNQDD